MDLTHLTDPDAVQQALNEFDDIGRDQFLTKYGYGKALSHFVRRNGNYYDSKAIAGVAYGIQHPDHGPLTPDEFSGGDATVKRRLNRNRTHIDATTSDKTAPAGLRDDLTAALADYDALLAMYRDAHDYQQLTRRLATEARKTEPARLVAATAGGLNYDEVGHDLARLETDAEIALDRADLLRRAVDTAATMTLACYRHHRLSIAMWVAGQYTARTPVAEHITHAWQEITNHLAWQFPTVDPTHRPRRISTGTTAGITPHIWRAVTAGEVNITDDPERCLTTLRVTAYWPQYAPAER